MPHEHNITVPKTELVNLMVNATNSCENEKQNLWRNHRTDSKMYVMNQKGLNTMNIEIANRLVQLRKANNLSQEQLAEKVGVSRQAVSKWERAEASPDTDNLIILSKIYGISLDEMLFSEDEPELPTTSIETTGTGTKQDEGYFGKGGYGTYSGGEGASTNPDGDEYSANPGGDRYGANSGGGGYGANSGWEGSESIAYRKKISKLMHAFPYPVFITIIFLLLGFIFHLWHPAWLIYLTIPIYYTVADSIGKT